MKNEEQPKAVKIEVDEKTSEPKLVEVDVSSLPQEKPESKPQEKPKKSEGRQLKMKEAFLPNPNEEIDKKQQLLKRVLTVLFVVIIVAALVWTFIQDFGSGKELAPASAIFKTLGENWYYFIFALIALFFSFFFKGLKLSVMTKHTTGIWHFKTCMQTAIVGHYYNYVTPLAVGGQPFEIYFMTKHGVPGGVAGSIPIAAFFATQFAFVSLGVASLILLKTNALGIPQEYFSTGVLDVASTTAIIGLALGLFMPLVVTLFALFPRPGSTIIHFFIWLAAKMRLIKDQKKTMFKTLRTVKKNSMSLKQIASSPVVFISSLLIAFGEQLAMLSIAYFTLRFFGFDLPAGGFLEWMQIMQICVILQAAISFFPTPGNSGAADVSFYFLFRTGLSKYGSGYAFPAILVWRLLSYYSYLIIGLIFTVSKKRADKKSEHDQQ